MANACHYRSTSKQQIAFATEKEKNEKERILSGPRQWTSVCAFSLTHTTHIGFTPTITLLWLPFRKRKQTDSGNIFVSATADISTLTAGNCQCACRWRNVKDGEQSKFSGNQETHAPRPFLWLATSVKLLCFNTEFGRVELLFWNLSSIVYRKRLMFSTAAERSSTAKKFYTQTGPEKEGPAELKRSDFQ